MADRGGWLFWEKTFRYVLVYRLEGSECHGLWYCQWMKSDMVQLECWLAGVQLGLTCSLRQPSVSLITVIQWICIKIMVHGRISILVNHSMNINFNVLDSFIHFIIIAKSSENDEAQNVSQPQSTKLTHGAKWKHIYERNMYRKNRKLSFHGWVTSVVVWLLENVTSLILRWRIFFQCFSHIVILVHFIFKKKHWLFSYK